MGSEAVELAASAGLLLDEWQQLVLEEALGEREDGQWSASDVGLIVPRQNGKGSILEARELAGLYLLDEMLIVHTAHEFKTSAEAFRRVLFLIENTPDLDRKVKTVTRSHGEEGIELLTGQRLRFLARSKGSGRGFSGDCVVLDEAYKLSASTMDALIPTMSAMPNPQTWFTCSPPLEDDPDSDTLRALMERGVEGSSPRLCYIEWSARPLVDEGEEEPPVDLDDRENWADANPTLGRRMSEETVEGEREKLTDVGFGRERLGLIGGKRSKPVIPDEDWRACRDERSQIEGQPVFAFEVAADRSESAIGVAGHRADQLDHVEIIDSRRGTTWVAGRFAELKKKWGDDIAVLCDASGPAGALVKDIEAEGVKVTTVSRREYASACGALYLGATEAADRRLRHIGQAELDAAVAGATKSDVGDGAFVWVRKSSLVNIAGLVAVTLALSALGSPEIVKTEVVSLADVLARAGKEDG